MKFLGTLAVGFSSVAAMLAALLSFGFHLKVESPGGVQQAAQQQQLAQCNTALSAAEEKIGQYQSRVAGLDLRLAELALVAESASARLAAGASQRMQAAQAASAASESGGSMPLAAGLGVSVLLFPLGYILGRRRREAGPALSDMRGAPLVIDIPSSQILGPLSRTATPAAAAPRRRPI